MLELDIVSLCKHEALGKEHDLDWRDTKIETHIKIPEFEKDLKELIKVHFENTIGSDKNGLNEKKQTTY